MDMSIRFPGLGIVLPNVGKSIHIGSFEIAFYGLVITFGMICGVLIAMHLAKKTGQNPDNYFDLAIIAIIASVIGARVYYVIFAWEDMFKDDPIQVFNIRNGGLAIYGGVITAIITTFIFTKVKKLKFSLFCDTAGCGLVLGQIIGRWGNFFNRECFGEYTDSFFAMQLPVSAVRQNEVTKLMWDNLAVVDGVEYIQVHPTFLYESLWNLCVLIIMLILIKKKSFDGEVFLFYLAGYGIGRFWIEGLRTDQLKLGHTGIAVSQMLGIIMFIATTLAIVIKLALLKHKNKES